MICWSPEVNTLYLLNLRHYDETFNISRMPHFLLKSLKSWWSRKILQFTLQVIFKKTYILHFIFHIFYAGINSSMVLKSEQQDMEAKRRNKKKKLGVNFGIHFHCSEKTSLTLVQCTTRGFYSCQETSTVCLSKTKQKKQLGNLLTSLYYVKLTIPLNTCLILCSVSFYYC